MAQYIKKSALIAEIEKAIDSPAPSHDQQCPWEDGYWCGLYTAEGIIDALEVKEVDLENEIDKKLDEEWYGEYINLEKFKRTAKHFFELGLKAQKGENAKEERYVVGVTGKYTTTTK